MTRYHGYPPSAPYVIAEPPRRGMRIVALLAAMIAVVFLASPYLPDVIRVTLPERLWRLLPSIEFVRGDQEPEPPVQAAALVPPPPPPPPVADTTAKEPPKKAAVVKPKPRPRPKPKPRQPTEEELEPDRPLWPDRSTTIVPVRVIRSVELSQRNDPAPVEQEPITTLLCVQVVDASGAPLAGVRVDLVEPPITVRTDQRGRFCLSCPPGPRTVHIEHPGYAPMSRDVTLSGMTVETRIALTPNR